MVSSVKLAIYVTVSLHTRLSCWCKKYTHSSFTDSMEVVLYKKQLFSSFWQQTSWTAFAWHRCCRRTEVALCDGSNIRKHGGVVAPPGRCQLLAGNVQLYQIQPNLFADIHSRWWLGWPIPWQTTQFVQHTAHYCYRECWSSRGRLAVGLATPRQHLAALQQSALLAKSKKICQK